MPSGQTQSPTGSRNKKKTSKHKKLEPNKKETRASSKVLWRTANGRIREKLKKDPAKKKKGRSAPLTADQRKELDWVHACSDVNTIAALVRNKTPEGFKDPRTGQPGSGPDELLLRFDAAELLDFDAVKVRFKKEFRYSNPAQIFAPTFEVGQLFEDLKAGEEPLLDDIKGEKEWRAWIDTWDRGASDRYEEKANRCLERLQPMLRSPSSEVRETAVLECWEFFHQANNVMCVQEDLVRTLMELLDDHDQPRVQIVIIKACWKLSSYRYAMLPMRQMLMDLDFVKKLVQVIGRAAGDEGMSLAATMQRARTMTANPAGTRSAETQSFANVTTTAPGHARGAAHHISRASPSSSAANRSSSNRRQPEEEEPVETQLARLASSALLEFADEPKCQAYMLSNMGKHIALAASDDEHCVWNGLEAIFFLFCNQGRKSRPEFLRLEGMRVLLYLIETQGSHLDLLSLALRICSVVATDISCRHLLSADECSDCFIAILKPLVWVVQQLSVHDYGEAGTTMHVPEGVDVNALDDRMKEALLEEGHRRLHELANRALDCLWSLSVVIANSNNFDRLDSHEGWIDDFLAVYHAEFSDLANVECIFGVLGWVSRSPLVTHDIYQRVLGAVVNRLTESAEESSTAVIREACASFILRITTLGEGSAILCDGVWERVTGELLRGRPENGHVDTMLATVVMALCADDRVVWQPQFLPRLVELLVIRKKHVLELVATGLARLLARDQSLDTHRRLGDLRVLDALETIASHCSFMELRLLEATYATLWLLSFEPAMRVRMALRGTLVHAASLLRLSDEAPPTHHHHHNANVEHKLWHSDQNFCFLKVCTVGLIWQLSLNADIVSIINQLGVPHSLIALLELDDDNEGSTRVHKQQEPAVAEASDVFGQGTFAFMEPPPPEQQAAGRDRTHSSDVKAGRLRKMRFQLKTMALWCLLSVLRDTKTLQSTFPQGTEEEYVIADRCIDIIEGYNPTSDPSLMVPPGLVFACLFALQKLAAMCHRQRKYLCQYALNGAMQFLLPLGQTLSEDEVERRMLPPPLESTAPLSPDRLRGGMTVDQQSELQTMCLHLLLNLSVQPQNRRPICYQYLGALLSVAANADVEGPFSNVDSAHTKSMKRDFALSVLGNLGIDNECKGLMYRSKLTLDSLHHRSIAWNARQEANGFGGGEDEDEAKKVGRGGGGGDDDDDSFAAAVKSKPQPKKVTKKGRARTAELSSQFSAFMRDTMYEGEEPPEEPWNPGYVSADSKQVPHSRVYKASRFGGLYEEGEDLPFDVDDARLTSLKHSLRKPVQSVYKKASVTSTNEALEELEEERRSANRNRSHHLRRNGDNSKGGKVQEEPSFSLRSRGSSQQSGGMVGQFPRSDSSSSSSSSSVQSSGSARPQSAPRLRNRSGADAAQGKLYNGAAAAAAAAGDVARTRDPVSLARPKSAAPLSKAKPAERKHRGILAEGTLKSSHRVGPLGRLGSSAAKGPKGEDRWKPQVTSIETSADTETPQRYGGPVPRKDTVVFEPGGARNTVVFRTPTTAPAVEGRVRAFRFKAVKGSLVGKGLFSHTAMGPHGGGGGGGGDNNDDDQELYYVYHHSEVVAEVLEPGDVPVQQQPLDLFLSRAESMVTERVDPPVAHFEEPSLGLDSKPECPEIDQHYLPETKMWVQLAHLDIPYGKIPMGKMVLYSRQDDDEVEDEQSVESVLEWWIGDSVFSHRKTTKENDSRSIYNEATMYHRACQLTMSRLLELDRFRKLVGLVGAEDPDALSASLIGLLHKNFVDVIDLYEFYSAISGENPFSMSENAFMTIMYDSGILEESGPCDSGVLSRIYNQVNIEVGDKKSVENKANEDTALMRHEWVEALYRVAMARYEHSDPGLNAGEKLEKLFDEYIHKEAREDDPKYINIRCAKADLEIWRRDRLYLMEVDLLFTKWRKDLEAIYWYYSRLHMHQGKCPFGIKEWMKLLDDANLIKTEIASRRDAKLALVQARLRVVDDLRSHDRDTTLSYCEFLEALGRLADNMSIPTPGELGALGVQSLMEMATLLAKKKDDADAKISAPARRPSAESIIAKKTQPLASKLFMLLVHIFSELGCRFKGKIATTDDQNNQLLCKFAPFMSLEQQKLYLGGPQDRCMEKLDRLEFSSLELSAFAHRKALAEKRLDEKHDGHPVEDWRTMGAGAIG